MRRSSVSRSASGSSFKQRASKAHRLNYMRPLRGGIRL